jgi:hypothetical protein
MFSETNIRIICGFDKSVILILRLIKYPYIMVRTLKEPGG